MGAVPGPEEAWFRLPAVLLDLLLLYGLHRWSCRTGGPVLGLLAPLFFALLPLEVEAARTARPYTMFALWTFIAFSGLVEAARRNGKPPPALVIRIVAGFTLALYTHYYGWIVLLAAAAFLLRYGRRDLIRWLAVPVLCYLPWIPIFIEHLLRGNPMIAGLTVQRLIRAGAALLMGQTVFLRAEGLDALTGVLIAVLFGFVLMLVWRALAPDPPDGSIDSYWAFVWLAGTPVLVSLVLRAFEEFYLIVALPFFALLMASGAIHLRGYRSLILFFVLLFLGGIYPQYSYEHQAWRDLALAAKRKIRPGDAIAYHIWFDTYPAQHYLKKLFAELPPQIEVTEETFDPERMAAQLIACNRLVLLGSYDRDLEQKRFRGWLVRNRGQTDIQLFQHTFLEVFRCSAGEPARG
jgi:hypothetical protein